jgi:hypothetical protein
MLSRSPCPARHVAGIEKMQTENSKNEMNRIHEDRRNENSRIASLGRGAGCNDGAVSMSPVSQEEQNMEWTENPPEEQKITRDLMRKPQEEQTTTMMRTGKPPEATGQDTSPDQKKRPFVAIREAKRRAVIWGFAVADVVSDDVLPYDFIAMKEGVTSFVRIRRIRDSWFDSKIVQERCRKEITGFRAMKQQPGLIFELWIRGYARAFHRYRILPDAIEKIGIVLEPETRAGKKALDEERRAGTVISKNDNRGRVVSETVPVISDTANPQENELNLPGIPD